MHTFSLSLNSAAFVVISSSAILVMTHGFSIFMDDVDKFTLFASTRTIPVGSSHSKEQNRLTYYYDSLF